MDIETQDSLGPLEPEDTVPAPEGSSVSRRAFVVGASVAGLGLAAGALPGVGQARGGAGSIRNRALTKNRLAAGMIGGPKGFPGASRYQYGANTEEGRAILAARALRKAGKAPDTLVVQALNFARPQFQNRFPAGATASIEEIWEKETGIKLKFVDIEPATEYQTNIRNASTRNGNLDLITGQIQDTGDYAEAGLLRPLDDFVAKYRPSWNDPKYGYAGGSSTVRLFNQYNGSTYWVAFDNDTQPFVYRKDLFDDPKEKANFADKYGQPLDVPKTWDDFAKVAAFFTRPDAPTPLYGAIERKSPYWGVVNWQHRFVSSADPFMPYFKPDGSANVNNTAGIRAATEHLKSLQWSEPGALSKDWLSGYATFGAGNGVMGGAYPNVTKLVVPANPQLDKGFGKFLRTDVQPGRMIKGKLVRRVVIQFNIGYGVNAFSPKSHHEAAYLFLQWAGGARMFTYLTANPGGYQDPHHTYSLNDPLVISSYGAEPMRALKEIIPRTAPPITLRGAPEYNSILDQELQKMLTGQQSPEKAMANTERRWNATTKRIGTAKQAKAIVASYDAFPPKGRYGPTKTIA